MTKCRFGATIGCLTRDDGGTEKDMLSGSVKKFNLKILAVGHLLFHSLNYVLDYGLYPFIIYKFGLTFGFIISIFLSAGYCLAEVIIYDWLKKDWLGIEAIKELVTEFFIELEEEARESWKRKGKRMLSWLFHKNSFGPFIFLSLKFDPMITTLYLRKGSHEYNNLSLRDWKIFWGSVLVSNVYWTLVSFTWISVLRFFVGRFL